MTAYKNFGHGPIILAAGHRETGFNNGVVDGDLNRINAARIRGVNIYFD